MSDRLTTYCDGCGKPKGESNHWHKAKVSTSAGIEIGVMVGKLDMMPSMHGPGVIVKDFCGTDCVLKCVAGLISQPVEVK